MVCRTAAQLHLHVRWRRSTHKWDILSTVRSIPWIRKALYVCRRPVLRDIVPYETCPRSINTETVVPCMLFSIGRWTVVDELV